MGIVFGFAGLRIRADGLSLRPCLPGSVAGCAFSLQYHGRPLQVRISREEIVLQSSGPESVKLTVYGKAYAIRGEPVSIPLRV